MPSSKSRKMPLGLFDFVSPPELVGTATAFFGGHIDLDPASSEAANALVGATRFYTPAENGLKQSWKAKSLYLFPPRDFLFASEQPPDKHLFKKVKRFKKSAQRVWLEELLSRYQRNEFEEALLFLTSTDVALLVTQKIGFDFPLCILREKPDLYWDEKELPKVKNTKCYGFIYYLPSFVNPEVRVAEFQEVFNTLGRTYI